MIACLQRQSPVGYIRLGLMELYAVHGGHMAFLHLWHLQCAEWACHELNSLPDRSLWYGSLCLTQHGSLWELF